MRTARAYARACARSAGRTPGGETGAGGAPAIAGSLGVALIDCSTDNAALSPLNLSVVEPCCLRRLRSEPWGPPARTSSHDTLAWTPTDSRRSRQAPEAGQALLPSPPVVTLGRRSLRRPPGQDVSLSNRPGGWAGWCWGLVGRAMRWVRALHRQGGRKFERRQCVVEVSSGNARKKTLHTWALRSGGCQLPCLPRPVSVAVYSLAASCARLRFYGRTAAQNSYLKQLHSSGPKYCS